jgi:hypothetical protein
MSSKAPKFHVASRCALTVVLVYLGFSMGPVPLLAQTALDAWANAFDQRASLGDFTSFEQHASLSYGTMPALKREVPALDELELALQPWGNNRELENACMQLLMESGGKRLHQLNAMYTMYQGYIESEWAASTLPYSFRWIPALTSQWNHAAFAGEARTGLWQTPVQDAAELGLRLDGIVDERGVPAASTRAAVHALQKFQRRFPNDPHRVLVAYLKGMAYATRWSGKVGYDADLDQWLALYKVVCRMMVNTDLDDLGLDWLSFTNSWQPVPCTGSMRRAELTEHPSVEAADWHQWIPWWTGDALPCTELEFYEVRIPPAYALPGARNASEPVAENQNRPTVTPEANSVPTESDYAPGFSCHLHEVKAGDTLWNISKRYPGTTPEWIAEINEITDYIRIGEVLCIPILP